jgi:hypothetical protein
MKALSIMQPWPDAIFFLGKDIENRTWYTHHRGSLAVHCGKGWDKEGEAFIKARFPDWDPRRAKEMRGGLFGIIWINEVIYKPSFEQGANGKMKSPWAFGPYCWTIANGVGWPSPTLLKKPVMANGQLRLFNTPAIFDLEISKVGK